MKINYNVSAMLANNALANNDDLLSSSLQKLSSGLKLNRAKDNPAGLAMAKRMNAQMEGLTVAKQNANDGVSVIETAEGALSEVSAMLQRMTELAVQASNATNTDEDREIIQNEVAQLKTEINRISSSTQFNGQPLLDGTYDIKAFTNENDVKVSTYSASIADGTYTVDGLSWTADGEATFTPGAGFDGTAADYSATMVDSQITVIGPNDFSMVFRIPEDQVGSAGSYGGFDVTTTGIGAMRLQIGANEGQVIALQIPAVNTTNLSLDGLDVSTTESAEEGIERVRKGIDFLNTVRGRLGAYQNRLESTTNSIDITNENMTSAYSRIMDVDMAEEMTQYSTYTVLTQAGTSVLAQANDRPSSVLQLLQ
ncbi:MAG: flagellin FliC3 [Lachnospiraceae bacterium]|nr:flagellin FliC3 [Lachnospiraceae bacterium]